MEILFVCDVIIDIIISNRLKYIFNVEIIVALLR